MEVQDIMEQVLLIVNFINESSNFFFSDLYLLSSLILVISKERVVIKHWVGPIFVVHVGRGAISMVQHENYESVTS